MRKESQGISVGNITGSSGIAIGHHAQASSVRQSSPTDPERIAAMLETLADQINAHADDLADAEPAREAAEVARAEAASQAPRWTRVRSMLRLIGPAVAGVAELTQAVDNIRELIPR
ncbi:MAG TPA: DUF5955 family protein [Trebonia sp.]|jgi:hypothetical protein|nr:DUF5955 family protein [Trebonia sp.]